MPHGKKTARHNGPQTRKNTVKIYEGLVCPTCRVVHKQAMSVPPGTKWIYCERHEINRHRSDEGYGVKEFGRA